MLIVRIAVSFMLVLMSTVCKAQISKAAEFCYAPTEKNVSYQDVLDFPKGAPTDLISYGDSKFQYAELWLPTSATSKRPAPLVVLIHGGCWLNEFDVSHTHALSTALRDSGYAVLALEYRRTGDEGGGWPGSYLDIQTATELLPDKLPNSIDKSKIAVLGHSAGGHLAMLYGSSAKTNPSVKLVIGLAPIVDLVAYSKGTNSCQTATPEFMGGSANERPNAYAQATLANKNWHHNTIVIQGSLDTIVEANYLDQISEKASEVFKIEGGGHFDMIHPRTHSFSALLRVLAQNL